jgi:hypothetical protein
MNPRIQKAQMLAIAMSTFGTVPLSLGQANHIRMNGFKLSPKEEQAKALARKQRVREEIRARKKMKGTPC